jgi:hypothetical protein
MWRRLVILGNLSGQAICSMKAFEDETFVLSQYICNHLQYSEPGCVLLVVL